MDLFLLFSNITDLRRTRDLKRVLRPRASALMKRQEEQINKCHLAQKVSESSAFQLLTQTKGDRKTAWLRGQH